MRPVNLSEELSDQSRKKWDEFCAALQNDGIAFPDDSELKAAFTRAFAFSDFVAKQCIRHPKCAAELILSGDLGRPYSPEEYGARLESLLAGVADEAELCRILREARRREMVRIAFRDLAGMADLTETMNHLSDFADACAEKALSILYFQNCMKFGIPMSADRSPQYLIVLGMGKLGAKELNFSSDIDLIFAYPECGQTCGKARSLSNDEFFTLLCRQLLKVLGANTPDGIVFRVDMGLRPYGEGGPVVMSFDAMESYYQIQGREWERYALIKARVIAGDKTAGKILLDRLNPFVYRRYLDFGVFESLREMKQKISLEVKRKGMKDHIKLGRGGIREIEFFGQIFQLIRGGVIPDFQERSIQNILNILAREHCIAQTVRDELQDAYIFLRNTEHRLQEFSDAQTAMLPSDSAARSRLAASMGFDDWESYFARLEKDRDIVHRHFNTLLEVKDSDPDAGKTESELKGLWQNLWDEEKKRNILSAVGFDSHDEILRLLNDLRNDLNSSSLTREGRERIDRLIPAVLKEIGLSGSSLPALDRILDLVRAIKKRTSYISLILENRSSLTHLVRLAKRSSWILSFLKRHPMLLDELLDPRTLYVPPKRAILETEIRRRLDRVSAQDFEAQMEALRIFKQINVLHVAAADITEAFPLMKVSDYLSDIAETVLSHAVDLAWDHLSEKHGHPVCCLNHETFDKGFAVIAYGKLGGLELGYDSDLDLVFLHSGEEEETKGGKQPIAASHFFARLGQRVIHTLVTRTPAGILYDADMRLRPSGSSGVLVSHIEAFRNYQLEDAWTWEKQALIRARPVIGDARMIARFNEIRKEILAWPRDKAKLREEVRNMRRRMREELSNHEPGIFDLKQDAGGIVDVEFLVQYLVLLHAYSYPELLEWTDNVRLIGTLARVGIIDDMTAHILRKAYLTYRTVGHRLSLEEKSAKVPEQGFRRLREKIKEIWRYFMESQSKIASGVQK